MDGLAKQVDSLLPRGPPPAFPGHGSLATSSGRWESVSIAPDYHDVPGTSRDPRGPRSAETSNGGGLKSGRKTGARNEGSWKLTIPEQRNDFSGTERQESPRERANVDSLAIWGGFPSVSGAEARPPKEFADNLSASGGHSVSILGGVRATHLRTSSEGDAPLWNGDRKTEGESEHVGVVTAADNSSGNGGTDQTEAGEEPGRVPSPSLEMQHGALYSPLEDDTVWESLMFGGPKNPVSVNEPDGLESHDYEQALANIQGHLDNRMLSFERYGGPIPEAEISLDGIGGMPETEVSMRPPQMPYVTLPNTPLHEAAGLRSQLSRSDSGTSSDFR